MKIQENRKALFEFLERQNANGLFGMSEWSKYDPHACGTVACIGGSAAILMIKENPEWQKLFTPNDVNNEEVAEWLGISEDVAYQLFYPEAFESYSSITYDMAVEALSFALSGVNSSEMVAFWESKNK
jgi:hypothetical protein